MSKFKIGDRVMVIGTISGTVIDVKPNGVIVECDEPSKGVEICQYPNKMVLWPNESQVELIAPNRYELHITCNDGKTTNAVYKVNGKIEKRTEAVCCPSDTFDFATGAQTALDRVFPKATPTQPIAPQEDKAKEPIKLYCVKTCMDLCTKGKIYTANADGHLTFDNGQRSAYTSDHARFIHEWKNNLAPLVSRPAKVGEWVLIVDETGSSSTHKGDVLKCVDRWCSGASLEIKGREVFSAKIYDMRYLVLPDYQPEPEKEPEPVYYSGKVVCVDRDGSRCFTQYKGYEFKNGIVIDDDGEEYNSPCKTLHDFNNNSLPQFIPYLGEA